MKRLASVGAPLHQLLTSSTSRCFQGEYPGSSTPTGYGDTDYHPVLDRPGRHFTDDGGTWDDGGGDGFDWKSRHLQERREVAMTFMSDVSKRKPLHDAMRVRAKLNRERLAMPPPPPSSSNIMGGEEADDDFGDVTSSTNVFSQKSEAAYADRDAASSVLMDAMLLNSPVEQETDTRIRQQSKARSIAQESDDGSRMEKKTPKTTDDVALDELFWSKLGTGDDDDDDMDEGSGDTLLNALASLPAHEIELLKHELMLGSLDRMDTAGENSIDGSGGGRTSSSFSKAFGVASAGGSAAAADQDALLRNWLKLRKESSDYHSYSSIPDSERTAWMPWYLKHVNPPRT